MMSKKFRFLIVCRDPKHLQHAADIYPQLWKKSQHTFTYVTYGDFPKGVEGPYDRIVAYRPNRSVFGGKMELALLNAELPKYLAPKGTMGVY